jgi:hypothetical protein
VTLVLDPPVAANLVGEGGRIGTGRWLAGDGIRYLPRLLADDAPPADHEALPFHPAALGELRPGTAGRPAAAQRGVERRIGACPAPACLQPAVAALPLPLGDHPQPPTARGQVSPPPGWGGWGSPAVPTCHLPAGQPPRCRMMDGSRRSAVPTCHLPAGQPPPPGRGGGRADSRPRAGGSSRPPGRPASSGCGR